MKTFLVLSVVLSVSAVASTIGACVPGALRGFVGNPCSLGDRVFESFADAGDADVSRIDIQFQMAATSSIQAPLTGASFFTAQSFANQIEMQAGMAPNIPSATPSQGVSSQLAVADSPGPDYVVSGTETISPALFAPTNAIVTTSTLIGPGENGIASPGLSSFELGADAVVPEPVSGALIGTGLLCLGLFRKRLTPGMRLTIAK